MSDTIREIIQWLFAGGGLLALIELWRTRRKNKAASQKDVESYFQTMYEANGKTMIGLQHKIDELQNLTIRQDERIFKLERITRRAAVCRYWVSCPLRPELQKYKQFTGEPDSRPKGQSDADRNEGDYLRTGPDDTDESGTECRPPPASSYIA
jgi:hypothetical protein